MSEPGRPGVDWRAVAAASMDGLGVVDGETFVHADAQLAASFGYDDPDDVVGRPWREFYPAGERDRIERETLPAVRRSGSWRGDVTGLRADGSTVPQTLSVRRADDGTLVWVVRESPERTAEQSNSGHVGLGEDHATAFENAPVPVGVFTADRGIVYCNPAAVEFLGAADRDAVLGRSPEQFVHPDDRETVGRRITQVIGGREATDPLRERFVGLDGEERVAEVATAPVTYDSDPAALVVINDVTEHVDTQRRLREERQFVQDVIDAIDDVLYVMDEDGRMHLWNDSLPERTGYTDEEIADIDPSEFLPPEQEAFVPGARDSIPALADRAVDLDLITSDGERIPHEFRGTTVENPEAGRTFRCGVARDVTERLERERELERYETLLETATDGVYALDENLRFTYANDALCEMVGLARDDLLGTDVRTMFGDEDDAAMAEALRERVVAGDTGTGTMQAPVPTPDGERRFEARYRLHPEPGGEFRGSVGVIRDVTDRVERERELERQRDELATLDRINELLLDIASELVGTGTRDGVERTVCERLAASNLYQFAWVGERELGSDRIVARTRAGDDEGLFDAAGGESPAGREAGRAMETRSVQTGNIESTDTEPWRAAAFDRGFRSLVATPLRYGETVYGVLVVYATRADAFSERERNGFAVLGEVVGFAINAIKRRLLLYADAVSELTVRITDPDRFLTRVSDEYDCWLSLDGYVSSGDRWVVYLSVDESAADGVAAAAADEPSVERVRLLGRADDVSRLELVVTDSSLLHSITPTGGKVRTATFEDGVGEFVVDLPADADAHEFFEQLDTAFATSELLARRERDRPPEQVQTLGGLLEDLTNRQREALETAFRAGYFDWPRASTAEDIAAALDVAAPTLHAHLRKAEQAVFTSLFE